MADSPKFSLLDLQTPDVSQYGKKNLDLQRETTRSTDSSYRKQLRESLSKKQQSASEKPQPAESRRTPDPQTERSRPERQESLSQTASEARESQAPVENEQRNTRAQDSVSDRSSTQDSKVVQTAPEPEAQVEDRTDSSEVTEEAVPVQQEVQVPAKTKAQGYSLFQSANQSESTLQQEVTTGDTEIRPPANFQFTDNQSLISLQTEVTETNPAKSLPIPEGLAELLKQHDIATTQTRAAQEGEIASLAEGDQQLQNAEQSGEIIASLTGGEQATVPKNGSEISVEQLKQIKMTDELKQAIEKYLEQNSEEGDSDTNLSKEDLQALLQRRYQGGEQQNTESTTDQQGQEQSANGQQASQQVSQTVIEQVQEQTDAVQPDKTELVEQKTEKQAEKNEQPQDQSGVNPVHPQTSQVADALQRALTESTKNEPAVQDHQSVQNKSQDQSGTQPMGLGQVSPAATETQGASAAGPVVDVKQVDQLVERIASAVKQSQSTGQQLKIRLSPPELGTLQIEVSLKNGEYSAKLEVQNRHAQKVINDNIAQLKDALTKTGVSLDRIDVHINTHSSEDQRSSQSDSQPQSGTDFDSNQFSDHSDDAEQGHQDRSFVEETIQRDDSEIDQEDRPHVARSQGVATDNVEEIDVQI